MSLNGFRLIDTINSVIRILKCLAPIPGGLIITIIDIMHY